MYRVSDEQIEFILNDIKKRGVEMEDLQLNLLDHICCILEQELTEEQNFETTYQKVIKQFFKHDLWEIEEETIFLLKYKNYYKMKRLLYILLFLSIGYNVFVFATMGYNYYQMKKWQSDLELMQKVNYSDGFNDFKTKLKAEYPEVLKKEFIYITFSGNFWEHVPPGSTIYSDTFFVNGHERSRIDKLKLNDSLASVYTKNISFIHVYSHEDKKINIEIEKNKTIAKNIIYVKDIPTLWSGYRNKKQKEGMWIPTTIIIDTTGKLIYQQGMTAQGIDKKLISVLKNIQ